MNTCIQGSIRLALALLLVGPLMLLSNSAVAHDAMSLDERVACQTKLEEIAWNETLWPDVNPEPKPARSTILSDVALRTRVENQLRMEAALAADYGIRISDTMLQIELNRMARNTRAPDRLRERFEALDNDPQRIAECMARPNLVRKYLRNAYVNDEREHGGLRQRAKAALANLDNTAALSASGAYDQTTVLVRRSDDEELADISNHAVNELKLDAAAFDAEADRLADPSEQPKPAGQHELPVSPTVALRETDEGFIHEQVLSRAEGRIEVRRLTWAKRPFEDWWSEQQTRWPTVPATLALSSQLILPRIIGRSGVGVTTEAAADSWRVETYYPAARAGHKAVWTGSEMIIWGGSDGGYNAFATGARYDPSSDTWTTTSVTSAPTGRTGHTAVWTGAEMIVWGGSEYNNFAQGTGGRYDPLNDSWTPTLIDDAPSHRSGHTAVWTGSEMIVWGSYSNNTGGRYDPSSDTWTATTTTGAPIGRGDHTVVWTGTEMIVWGGWSGSSDLATGGRYDPLNDVWTPTTITNAPTNRAEHIAAWTGSEMIVWGGRRGYTDFATGGRYNPLSDTWTATTIMGAPDARRGPIAVWSGTEMIVWGGWDANGGTLLATGGRYSPSNDTWTAITTSGAPTARGGYTAVWTGSEVIVWGGWSNNNYLSTGSRYDPSSNTWIETATSGAPTVRSDHTAVWTGNAMIVWGGYGNYYLATGGRYDPVSDRWTATTITGAPDPRSNHTAVWTGNKMIIWGGYNGGYFLTGGIYDPLNDAWTATRITGAPEARRSHTAVWTGNKMIVWGGYGNYYLATGGRYDPSNNSWSAITGTDAPTARWLHTTTWTGSKMIVWGGFGNTGDGFASDRLATGGRYDPSTDSWTATTTTGAPAARHDHTAVWTGSEMIVWGGINSSSFLTGGRYDPLTDSWVATTVAGAPAGRSNHTAIWTGTEMIIWGGYDNTGGRYDPSNNSWMATAVTGAPAGRGGHTAVWTGNEMIVWGNYNDGSRLDFMGVYYPYNTKIFRNGFETVAE